MKSKRHDARLALLKTPEFKTLSKATIRVFGIENIALIGGLAVAHYANPPVTMDADFLVRGSCGDILEAVESFFAHPWDITTMTFKNEIPEHCVRVARKGKDAVLDFLPTGRNAYLRSVVERAIEIEVQNGLFVPIATVEDVIVLKTIAGRDKDVEDNAAMGVKLGEKIDRAYIRQALSGMH